jgi:hypothetical protein
MIFPFIISRLYVKLRCFTSYHISLRFRYIYLLLIKVWRDIQRHNIHIGLGIVRLIRQMVYRTQTHIHLGDSVYLLLLQEPEHTKLFRTEHFLNDARKRRDDFEKQIVMLLAWESFRVRLEYFSPLNLHIKKNSMVRVSERTIPTERPPLVGEVIANFCG